jgi:glycosyltransferase involved in cell wall biosynthesis
MLHACALARRRRDLVLVMACRAKSTQGAARRAALGARAQALGVSVRWVGETPAIHALLAASDIVALPTDTLYAKVDHPLVLLEAMHLGRPVLVSEGTSAFELAEEGGAIGARFDAEDLAVRLDALVDDPAARDAASAAAASHARGRSVAAMAQAYESLYDELLR